MTTKIVLTVRERAELVGAARLSESGREEDARGGEGDDGSDDGLERGGAGDMALSGSPSPSSSSSSSLLSSLLSSPNTCLAILRVFATIPRRGPAAPWGFLMGMSPDGRAGTSKSRLEEVADDRSFRSHSHPREVRMLAPAGVLVRPVRVVSRRTVGTMPIHRSKRRDLDSCSRSRKACENS